jgi:putative ABC transport system permease protein
VGRSVFQLIVLGYGLAIVFALPQAGTCLFLGFLLLVTTQFTWSRLEAEVDRWMVGLWLILASGLPSTYALLLVLRPDPWYSPQYWIPWVGLSLGSAAAVALQTGNGFWQALQRDRHQVEIHLSLGATIDQALKPWKRSIFHNTISPRLQQISWVGLITLPLFLGGQLAAGVDPLVAVEYEILLIFVTLNSSLIIALGMINIIQKKVNQTLFEMDP